MEAMVDGCFIKEEPDSSENADYPDPDCVNEDSHSLSPASEDAENRSASTGSGSDQERLIGNRRKRKAPMPMKLQIDQDPLENNTMPSSQVPTIRDVFTTVKQEIPNNANDKVKQCAVMTEERARNQAINSMPRSTCPVCGDKANGLHYGIYTCEACKNFFKRSVAFDAAKSYVCKYNRTCNVNITEVDGVKMKGPRCQACRYQACLDAGMYHSGVQRTRGGRHGYSPIKQRSNSIEKYPTIPAPNISAVMASISKKSNNEDNQLDYNMDPADLVSVSMEHDDHNHDSNVNVQDQHFLHKSQLWESFASENVRNEVDMLRSRATIAETLLNEKTKQLDIVHKQVEMLKNHLLNADQLNKEQAIMIESLKRRLLRNNQELNTANGDNNRDQASGIMFENGGVTITPVTSTSSTSTNKISSSSQNNLLSHLLHSNGSSKYHNNGDMATIEPIIESRSKS